MVDLGKGSGSGFNNEELSGAVILDEDWELGVQSSSLLLVGQVMGKRAIHWENLTNLVSELWSPNLGVVVKKTPRTNRFLFSFKHATDKARALNDGPWQELDHHERASGCRYP